MLNGADWTGTVSTLLLGGTGSIVMLRIRVCSQIYVPYADILCMRENRRAKRRDFFARVTINWQNETETRQDPGLVEDRSETGFGIRMRFPVTVGATVEIRLVNQNYVGTVRRCNKSGLEYFVGVELQKVA